ncbi:MAG: hypothetical protein OXK79_09550, partial [Chloroflexota bacterium]|nr:hypothetical protein [Chloroflexota bacterium]
PMLCFRKPLWGLVQSIPREICFRLHVVTGSGSTGSDSEIIKLDDPRTEETLAVAKQRIEEYHTMPVPESLRDFHASFVALTIYQYNFVERLITRDETPLTWEHAKEYQETTEALLDAIANTFATVDPAVRDTFDDVARAGVCPGVEPEPVPTATPIPTPWPTPTPWQKHLQTPAPSG